MVKEKLYSTLKIYLQKAMNVQIKKTLKHFSLHRELTFISSAAISVASDGHFEAIRIERSKQVLHEP